MTKKVINPIGKIFRFSKEHLKFSASRQESGEALVPDELYLCRDILNTRERMSAGDSVGDSKESAIFMPVSTNGKVDESNPIEATTNWWHTEVKLLEECVVGEIEIQTKVIYKVKKMPERFSLLPFLGRTLTMDESDVIVREVNRFADKCGIDCFTIKELNAIFKKSPLTFKSIDDFGYGYENEIINDLLEVKSELVGHFGKEEEFFDFNVHPIQIESTRKMLTKRHFIESEMEENRIKSVLVTNTMLYFDSFDGSIDDTAPRDVYREIVGQDY